jgi:subtilisin family serine protease
MEKIWLWISYRFGRKNIIFAAIFVLIIAVVAVIMWKMVFGSSASESAANKIPGSTYSDKFDGYIVEFKADPLSKASVIGASTPVLSSAQMSTNLIKQKSIIQAERDSFYAKSDTTGIKISQDKNNKDHSLPTVAVSWSNAVNAILIKQLTYSQASQISRLPQVKKVYPNREVAVNLMDSVPLIGADRVWREVKDQNNNTVTGTGVRVGIIDTGIDYTHGDFGSCTTDQFINRTCAKVAGGYDFVNSDNNPMDGSGHGTHVAGTVASNGNVKGVAPDAILFAYKVLDDSGSGNWSGVISGIEASLDPNNDGNYNDRLDIISLSLGGKGDPDDPVSQAIDNVVGNGIVAIVAAGNSGPSDNSVGSPGSARKAITVGATFKKDYTGSFWSDSDPKKDQITNFSSRGPVRWGETNQLLNKPDVVAPGALICASRIASREEQGRYVKCVDDNHILLAGTSMATPIISGVAALVKQAHPNWTPDDIKSVIRMTAQKLTIPGTDKEYDLNSQGFGRVDAYKAVSTATPPPISSISTNGLISEDVTSIIGSAGGKEFTGYQLYYTYSTNPSGWELISESNTPVTNGELAKWNITQINDGVDIYLRLIVLSGMGSNIDNAIVRVNKAIITSPLPFGDGNDAEIIHMANNEIEIKGVASGEGFENYYLSWCKVNLMDGFYNRVGRTRDCKEGWQSTGITLEADGVRTVNMGVLGKWTPSRIPDIKSGPYLLKLSVNANIKRESSIQVYIDADMENGWPISLSMSDGDYEFDVKAPLVADINSNGKSDVLVYRNGLIHAVSGDGNELPGWPVRVGPTNFSIEPFLAGDINGDSKIEIVAGNGNSLYVYNSDGILLSGWPKYVNTRTVLLADMNADDVLDIVTFSMMNYNDNTNPFIDAAIWSYTGEKIASKKVPGLNYAGLVDALYPSVGDINGDGKNEIILLSQQIDTEYQINAMVSVVDMDGRQLPGWPLKLQKSVSAMVVADIDSDGNKEIIIRTLRQWPYTSNDVGRLIVLTSNGQELYNWQPALHDINSFYNTRSIALGDINNDGKPELAFASEQCPMFYTPSGVLIYDTYGYMNECRPFLSMNDYEDMTIFGAKNDSRQHIFTTGYWGYAEGSAWTSSYNIYDGTGHAINGYPKISKGEFYSTGSAAGDLDADGKNEIVFITYNSVVHKMVINVIKTNGSSANNEWPMNLHDSYSSRFYVKPPQNIVPNAPQNVSITATENSTSLKWSPVDGATSYNLYWSEDKGVDKKNGQKIENVSNTYIHNGLSAKTNYFYVVTAVRNSQESVESDEVYTSTSENSKIYVPNRDIQYGNTTILKGYLYKSSNSQPIYGKILNFWIGDKLVGSSVTDGEGKAQLSTQGLEFYPNQQSIITVRWLGDSMFKSSQNSANFTVSKMKTYLFSGDRSAAVGEEVEIRALARYLISGNPPFDYAYLTFSVDGNYIGGAWTNNDGWATIRYTPPKGTTLGVHQVNCNFSGDDWLESSSTKSVLNVIR